MCPGADRWGFKMVTAKKSVANVHSPYVSVGAGGKKTAISATIIKVENMILDLEKKDLTIIDDRIELTKKEFEILRLFLENQTRVFSRDEILHRIWGEEVVVSNRTVDVNITRLRKKIKHYGEFLKNRPGLGYYFEVES